MPDFIQLTNDQIIFSIIIIFLAYTVKGLTGFGSGLVAMPLLAFIFPVTFIVPAMGLLSYTGTIIQSVSLRKHAAWRDVWPIIPFSLAGIGFALWLLTSLDAGTLTLSLGVFVVLYAVYSLLPLKEISGGRRWAVIAGACGGLVGALFGTGGPFYVIYLKMRQLDRAQFRATIATIFLLDGGFRITGYASSGLYNMQVIWLVIILFPVLLIAMYVGHHIHVRINQVIFNRIINIMLLISGSMLIVKSI